LARSYLFLGFRLLLDSQSKHRPFHPVKTRVRRIVANFACGEVSRRAGRGKLAGLAIKGYKIGDEVTP
jgi:hypothetical protein